MRQNERNLKNETKWDKMRQYRKIVKKLKKMRKKMRETRKKWEMVCDWILTPIIIKEYYYM